MKIVVLDGRTVNKGDLSWEGLKALGECTIHEATSPGEIAERCKEADAVLTNKVPFDGETLMALPNLKYIGVLATGYNIIDTEVARKRGVIVTNIPSYSTRSVVQMVFAHLLNITNRAAHYTDEVREGAWSSCSDFCFWDTPLIELADKTFGIVRLGNIGMAVAHVAHAFGMKVIASTSKKKEELPDFITPVEKETLFRESDVLSLHCPLTATTKGFVNAETLEWMKPTAILINTGRGPLIDEQAVADALNSGSLSAAGVDVLSTEPPTANNPLLTAKNCHFTPHIAWATKEARIRLMDIAINNLKAYQNGKPIHVV